MELCRVIELDGGVQHRFSFDAGCLSSLLSAVVVCDVVSSYLVIIDFYVVF